MLPEGAITGSVFNSNAGRTCLPCTANTSPPERRDGQPPEGMAARPHTSVSSDKEQCRVGEWMTVGVCPNMFVPNEAVRQVVCTLTNL